MRTAFSYYGGKGRLVNKYPAQQHRKIIEPFAGGAAYSLKYYKHDVTLYDINRNTCDMWWFLQSKIAIDLANKIPICAPAGSKIDDIIIDSFGDNPPNGLVWILRSAANIGTCGTGKRMNTVTKFGSLNWERNTISKIKYWSNKIRHWKIINKPWFNAQSQPDTTYFIDPPYSTSPGNKYANNAIDFRQLSEWIRKLRGQTIVCGHTDETYLDFRPISNTLTFRSGHIKTKKIEGIWTNH